MKRQRSNRYKVECLTCGNIFEKDYKRKHEELCHNGNHISIKMVRAPSNPFDAARKKIRAGSNDLSVSTTNNFFLFM